MKSYGSSRFKEAKALAKEREYGYAMEILDELAVGFKDTKLGDNAKAIQKEWKSDKAIKLELTAASILAKAAELEDRKNYKGAYQVLLQLTKSKKYRDTKAAVDAKKRIGAVKQKM